MKLQQILVELAMGQGALEQLLAQLKDQALVGYEVEVILPTTFGSRPIPNIEDWTAQLEDDLDGEQRQGVIEDQQKELHWNLRNDLHKTLNKLTSNGIEAVEDDSTINFLLYGDHLEYFAAEIITKPLPVDQALKTLATVFLYLNKHGVITDETTGLHINVSLAGQPNIDWLKLALFVGEKYVLQQFARLGNINTTEHLKHIMRELNFSGTVSLSKKIASEFDAAVAQINKLIPKEKYRTFNVLKYDTPNNKYVEFRMPGGTGYTQDFEKVRNATLRFVKVLALAANPNAARQEYMKKVAQMLSLIQGSIVRKPEHDIYAVSAPIQGLERISRFIQQPLPHPPENRLANNPSAIHTFVDAFSMYMAKLLGRMELHNFKLTDQERIAFKKYGKMVRPIKQKLGKYFEEKELVEIYKLLGI